MAVDIRVGTSGWHYPTGRGTWNGVFYPARRPKAFSELAYYAEHFDTVEVNSSFYRVPEPDTARKWMARTPPGFLFSIKLYQKFTHPEMFLSHAGGAEWNVSAGDVDQFRRAIAPLAEGGRLAALLVQFPPSFHAAPETRGYVDWILTAFAGYPLAVELRHRTWSDAAADTHARLAAHHASWVLVDEPKFKDSIRQPDWLAGAPSSTDAPLYVRLHGRNAAAWWKHDAAEDRYDYLYPRRELEPFARLASAAPGRRVLMYLNNHFSAKAVANAAVLKHELGQPLPGEYSAGLVARYPELVGLVATSGLPL